MASIAAHNISAALAAVRHAQDSGDKAAQRDAMDALRRLVQQAKGARRG